MTNQGPQTIDTAVTAAVQAIANRSGGSIIGATWWDHKERNNREWRLCRQYFVARYSFITEEDVLNSNHTFDFDQSLREHVVCKHCQAKEGPEPGMNTGHADCPLAGRPWTDNPLHPGISKNWYLYIKCYERGRWAFEKTPCINRHLRQEQIAQLEGREVNIGGGMRGVEIHDR